MLWIDLRSIHARTLRELISKTMRMDSERGTRSFDTSVSTCISVWMV